LTTITTPTEVWSTFLDSAGKGPTSPGDPGQELVRGAARGSRGPSPVPEQRRVPGRRDASSFRARALRLLRRVLRVLHHRGSCSRQRVTLGIGTWRPRSFHRSVAARDLAIQAREPCAARHNYVVASTSPPRVSELRTPAFSQRGRYPLYVKTGAPSLHSLAEASRSRGTLSRAWRLSRSPSNPRLQRRCAPPLNRQVVRLREIETKCVSDAEFEFVAPGVIQRFVSLLSRSQPGCADGTRFLSACRYIFFRVRPS